MTSVCCKTYIEQECRDRSEAVGMDQSQAVWKVALAGPHEEQPGTKSTVRNYNPHCTCYFWDKLGILLKQSLPECTSGATTIPQRRPKDPCECSCDCCQRHSPGGSNNGGIKSPVTGHCHGNRNDPANGSQNLISKSLWKEKTKFK